MSDRLERLKRELDALPPGAPVPNTLKQRIRLALGGVFQSLSPADQARWLAELERV